MGDTTLTDELGRQFRFNAANNIGSGTFADVFLGIWTNGPSETKVAIKRFKDINVSMLNAEISIMRKLDHPNIVKMISAIRITQSVPEFDDRDESVNSDETNLFVILEYCPGGDFKRYIRGKRLSEKHACKYLKQLAEGLRYLHSNGIIHRDLKPHNLLLNANKDTLKIADFGFAKVIDSERMTATMCGTPLYMAPEILRGDTYTASVDLWSVGVILYEMLCGERPFKDVGSIVELKKVLVQEPIRYKREVKDALSGECKALLVGLLQKDAKKRINFQSFFDNDWFKLDWNRKAPSIATLSTPATPATPATIATLPNVAIPRSAPMKIPSVPGGINTRMIINDYVDRISGPRGMATTAPARTGTVPMSPSSNGSNGSIFLSTTPRTGHSDPNWASAQSQSGTKSKSGIIADVMATGFGLLKESFQSNGF